MHPDLNEYINHLTYDYLIYDLYDEFIVYHEEQINLRFIIKLKVLDL